MIKYQRYDWFLLRSIISIGYALWIVYSSLITFQISKRRDNIKRKENIGYINDAFTICAILFIAYLYHKQAPLQYYVYTFFPLFFAYNLILQRHVIIDLFKEFNKVNHFIAPIVYIATIRILV